MGSLPMKAGVAFDKYLKVHKRTKLSFLDFFCNSSFKQQKYLHILKFQNCIVYSKLQALLNQIHHPEKHFIY